MSRVIKLKPCPFCGHTYLTIVKADHVKFWVEWYVECCQCASMGKQVSNKKKAIEAWNKRTKI